MQWGIVKTRIFRHLTILSAFGISSAKSAHIEIDAGPHPRTESIMTVVAPGLSERGILESDDKKISGYYQKASDDTVTFIVPSLSAGQKLTLREGDYYGQIANKSSAVKENDQILLNVRNKPVVTYQTTARKSPRENLDPKFLRGGYLHPLFTPSGKTVTDDYALNHLHHHGVWTAWTKTSFDGREPDFWNMGQGKGKVDFVSLEKTWSGPVEAGLVSKLKQTDLTSGSPIDVLNETWTVRTYAAGKDFNIIDLESAQVCATDKPLLLPVYHYGSIGIRGREEWNGKDKASFVTSEKFTDRNKANSQPARWIAMNGAVEGGTAGIAILSHPDNFRAPQPIRTHPSEPFISFAPQTNEAMSIQPGETYRMKYRFITFDGEPDAAKLEALWQDYAHPVKAVWKD